MRRWFARAVLVAGCLSLGAPLQAQQEAMTEIYGQAVHHYFAGDYAGAESMLNQVQAAGSADPRVHYYLGLCKAAQGGPLAGVADFEAGAQAEATSKNSYQVGLALTRIQGSARREIEKARLAARIQVRQQQLAEKRARTEAAGASVPATPPAPVDVPPATGDVPDPLTEGVRSDASTVDPVQPVVPDTSDPFGDDPSTPAAQPGTPAPNTPAAPADATDPFGAPAAPAGEPAMDDPFGSGT